MSSLSVWASSLAIRALAPPLDRVEAKSDRWVANWAKNFDNYSGQKLELDGPVVDRAPDKIVKTKLSSPGATPVSLAYRMRQDGGSWKVIDVFYNSTISQLTTQRSDFASTLQSGGAKALIAKLDAQTDKLLKG